MSPGNPPIVSRRLRRRVTYAAAIGNLIETYDYAVFGFLAVMLGGLFFPASEPAAALLSSFAVFGVAFVVRPLGSLLFGAIADRIGRRPALVGTLVLMAGATAAIGLLPTAAAIGVWAPVLLVACRLLQGLAAGGEYGTAMTYAAEHAPGKGGSITSKVQIGSVASLLLAAGVVLLLNVMLSEPAMSSWGWRIPFLLALPFGLIGLYIRARLEESPEFIGLLETGESSTTPVRESFLKHAPLIGLVFAIAAFQQIGYYVAFFYAQAVIVGEGFTAGQATAAVACSIAVATVLVAVGGPLSDRVGRWPLLMVTSGGMLVFAYPIFAALSGAESFGAVVLLTVLLGVLPALYMSVAPITYLESVPSRVRATVFSAGFALAAAVLGGPALYVSQYLINLTGDSRAPAFYLMFAAAVSLGSSFVVRARRPEVLVHERGTAEASSPTMSVESGT